MRFISFVVYLALQIQTNWSQSKIDLTVNCTAYKTLFGSAVSQFTSCAVANAKPITLCESCVDPYIDVLESYRNLSQISDVHGPCASNYVNLDRLEIIDTMYLTSYNLWNRAKCYECFQIANGTLTHNRSAETIKFNGLYNSTVDCVNRHHRNATELCLKCMDTYTALSDFYNGISNENENIPVCMDIVDLMNGTRSFWSDKCCLYRRHPEYLFLTSTGCMLLLTVLFYALAKACVDKKSARIYLQSRFAESLNQVGS